MAAWVVLSGTCAFGQEMEPRAYSASPVGANFLIGGASWSGGSIVFDPALPITDVSATVQGYVVGFGHSFNAFGKHALLSVVVPYAHADVDGQVFEQRTQVTRSGLADTRARFSINLRGNPAMTAREFAATKRRTIVGASVTVAAPTGQYYPTKLINVGTNRWAVKPEVGISVPRAHWDFDGYFGLWFYSTNGEFFPADVRRSQDAILTTQAHASYTFRPRLWLAADSTWYWGGRTSVDGGEKSESMRNVRLGLTASIPAGPRQSIKVAYGNGIIARSGTDFSTVAVAWQMVWLSRRWSGL